jgi:predicted MPP superfamily phosphohydrolase
MRFFLFIGILLSLDLYAFQALRLISQPWSATAKLIVYTIYWSMPVLLLIYVGSAQAGYHEQLPKALTTLLRSFLFIAYFSKFLVALFVFADDARRGMLWLFEKFTGREPFNYQRSRFLSLSGLLLGSIPLLTLSYGMWRNPYRYTLYRKKIVLPQLPTELRGLRIVQISDIHAGSFLHKEPIKQAIELINAQRPDIVLFTGDLVNNKADEMDNLMDVFDKIQAKLGVFSVLGNHDYGDYVSWPSPEAKAANMDKLRQIHQQLGWNLLLNEHRLIYRNQAAIAVIGVENYSAQMRFPKYGKLKTAHQGTENVQLRLLLSHDPSHWKYEVTKDFKDIDITFSGHTHGMQFGVEIPGWFKWSPIQYVYKEWAGLYKEENQYLYVNRGFGFLGYPGRVGILPEITLIELNSTDSSVS